MQSLNHLKKPINQRSALAVTSSTASKHRADCAIKDAKIFASYCPLCRQQLEPTAIFKAKEYRCRTFLEGWSRKDKFRLALLILTVAASFTFAIYNARQIDRSSLGTPAPAHSTGKSNG